MLKRNKGVLFLILGFLLILIACGWYIFNIAEDKSAGQQASDILTEFDNAQKENPNKNV